MLRNNKIYFRELDINSLDYEKLTKIGAGHDGIVYRYNDIAIKIFKHDIKYIEENNLMTEEKANYFNKQFDLKRFVCPSDIVIDEEGKYIGYTMRYLQDITKDKNPKKIGDYKCSKLIDSIIELREDFTVMTSKNIVPIDINRNSYIYANDFIHICDMDKFKKQRGASMYNKTQLNFIISKFLLYEMKKLDNFNNKDLKLLSNWCRSMINNNTFIEELLKELDRISEDNIYNYVYEKKNNVLKK